MDALTRLALRAGDGDGAALEGLVEGAYDQVWRLCARLVDEQAADDLAQDVFIRVVAALPGYRGASSARTWLLAIARNACMDELRVRSRRRRRDTALAADAATRNETVPDPGQGICVVDALTCLSPERREAFVLTQVLGLPYAAAADVCACPVGTIRSRVARARDDLLVALAAGQADGEQQVRAPASN